MPFAIIFAVGLDRRAPPISGNADDRRRAVGQCKRECQAPRAEDVMLMNGLEGQITTATVRGSANAARSIRLRPRGRGP